MCIKLSYKIVFKDTYLTVGEIATIFLTVLAARIRFNFTLCVTFEKATGSLGLVFFCTYMVVFDERKAR